ncbi:MAG: acetate/propionate family kinase [Christensenellales bacterium]|jgi:acetate kinase
MNILVVNAGSSSLKYQLIKMTGEQVLAKGICERIGIKGSVLKHTPFCNENSEKVVIERVMKDHTDAIRMVLDVLTDKECGVVEDMSEIQAVGHRIVHGREKYKSAALINEDDIEAIAEYIEFAPLHQPANLMGIKACQAVMPGVPMVSVFDTAFHQTMEPKAFLYGLPYEDYDKLKIRRYGFHGTSHAFVATRAAELLGKNIEDTKIITCHLGNGSSITAVDGGKSVDTSMGFTPLEGVIMGTRTGSLDPAIIQYVMDKKGFDIDQMVSYMNKKSGMLGLSGVSSDFRDIHNAVAEGNERARMALEAFCYGVKKYVGAYSAAMGGVDCIVFTAGIGENDAPVRNAVLSGLEYLGVDYDPEKNNVRGQEAELTRPGSKVKAYVIPTNEELFIARETLKLVKG